MILVDTSSLPSCRIPPNKTLKILKFGSSTRYDSIHYLTANYLHTVIRIWKKTYHDFLPIYIGVHSRYIYNMYIYSVKHLPAPPLNLNFSKTLPIPHISVVDIYIEDIDLS
ncbi:hypothetical protein EYC84_005827 [Monilinia fructicola]|uniref:Uncharacterized protein n=1 Tax=Monilinia fructicola TaxID=38448 RepID=A0A5M9JYP2_MONFR|nr:hypothetical protein EYC84_005827 [Monilinia fructicola]